MATNQLSINKAAAWKRLRFLQRLNMLLYFGAIPGILLLAIVFGFFFKQVLGLDLSIFIVGIPWAIAIIISNTLLFTCVCPECSQPFFVKMMTFWHGFFFVRRACIHCGASASA
ncbi:MAG TPA: hypothetical protein PLN21_01555 [Gemmatales bacterium]|nr:hypothetical protein [Gemmatales bacterium]